MRKFGESLFLKLMIVFVVAAGLMLTILELDEDLFLATARREVISSALLLIILSLTYLTIRRILSPIKTLEKGVQDLASGNYSVAIPVRSRDELGRVIGAFNEMATQVRNTLRAREQLLLDVSHEFRSPLTRIRLALEVPGDERQSIRNAVSEMETMVSEILESARMESEQGGLKLEDANLALLIQEISSRYENAAPGIALESKSKDVVVRADLARMRIAIQNVIDNAVKYSSHQKEPVRVTWSSGDPDFVTIQVKDSGIGIPKDDQVLVFEPFYRVDQSRVKSSGGYGLGLALTERIMVAHGGGVDLESRPGETIFTLRVPKRPKSP